jgi:hypothetical protein
MDILAFCEDHPDWIQFINAHVQLHKLNGGYLTFLDRAPLDLLGGRDVLLIIGHGSPESIGKYSSATDLANLLVKLGLRDNGATIRLQTCSSADSSETANPTLFALKTALKKAKRGSITIEGAKAPSITGWRHTSDRVVPHEKLPQAGQAQEVSKFQNQDQISSAEAYITAHLQSNLDSQGLIDIARHVHTLTANFFMDFAARVQRFTVGDKGFVSA